MTQQYLVHLGRLPTFLMYGPSVNPGPHNSPLDASSSRRRGSRGQPRPRRPDAPNQTHYSCVPYTWAPWLTVPHVSPESPTSHPSPKSQVLPPRATYAHIKKAENKIIVRSNKTIIIIIWYYCIWIIYIIYNLRKEEKGGTGRWCWALLSSPLLLSGGAPAAGFIRSLTSPPITPLPPLQLTPTAPHLPLKSRAIARRSTASPIRSPPHTPDRIPQVSALPTLAPARRARSHLMLLLVLMLMLLGLVPAAS